MDYKVEEAKFKAKAVKWSVLGVVFIFISFENADPIPPEGNYTITELCGEEKV